MSTGIAIPFQICQISIFFSYRRLIRSIAEVVHHYGQCNACSAVLIAFAVLAAHVSVQACPVDLPYTACPDALTAAQFLTGSNPYLPVSNAVFSGACSGPSGQLAVVTTFTPGCHFLSALMPQGDHLTKCWRQLIAPALALAVQ